MADASEPADSWLGKSIVLAPDVKVGSLVRIEERDGKLVGLLIEPRESPTPGTLIFRVEEGLAPNQIRIRRVRGDN